MGVLYLTPVPLLGALSVHYSFRCGFLCLAKRSRGAQRKKLLRGVLILMKFRNTTSQLRDFASDEWKRGAPALRQCGFEYIHR
jgi:hypothetical protein